MLKSFPPIVGPKPRVLILGTMPSVKSLEKHEYYGHPQNAFWKIMTLLYGDVRNYSAKKRLLKRNHIALWDVVGTCRRPGSSDSNISDACFNDVKGLLKRRTSVKKILLNGGKAAELYLKHAGSDFSVPYEVLPSTSPANTKNFADKLRAWRKALEG